MNFKVQTRSMSGELRYWDKFKDAISHSNDVGDIWKISFPLPTGERVRLIKNGSDWLYEDIISGFKK